MAQRNRGVTLTEIVVVVSIFTLILVAFAYNYQRFLDQQRFNADFEQIVSIIRDAHTRTLSSRDESGQGGRQYGIFVLDPVSVELEYVDPANGGAVPCTQAACGYAQQNPFTVSSATTIRVPKFIDGATSTVNTYKKYIFYKRISGGAQLKQDDESFLDVPTSGTVPPTITVVSTRISGLQRSIKIYPTGLLEITN